MSNNKSTGGIGFTGLLQIAFIVLKLLNVISWSWWIVLLPLEISAALCILIIIISVIYCGWLKKKKKKKKKKESE